jgi:hypothetical protein
MSYKLQKGPDGVVSSIIRDGGNVFIPMDPSNREYRKYLAWVEAGNTPLPADDPAPPVILASPDERIEALEMMLDMVMNQGAGL